MADDRWTRRTLLHSGAAVSLVPAVLAACADEGAKDGDTDVALDTDPAGDTDVDTDVETDPAATDTDPVPEATAETREQKRFGRYDKDRDGDVTRDEYLAQRRKAYAKLDVDGDGKLSFDEWAVKAATKFATADRDKSGGMTAAEFATTAVKRKPKLRCPPAGEREPAAEES